MIGGHADGGTPMPVRRRGAAVASLALLALLVPLTGCGGGSGETPSPTTSPTRSVSSPTRSPDRTQAPTPTPTESPSRTAAPTRSAAPSPTLAPTSQAPTSQAPTPTAPTTTRSVTLTPTPTPTPTPSPTPTPTATPTSELPSPTEATSSDGAPVGAVIAVTNDSADEGTPSWVWWLLAALVIGAAVLVPLLLARSRRAAWHQRLAAARAEVGWLARELLPQLRGTGSVEGVAGGWQIAVPRVAAVEDELTVLESSAKSEEDGASARVLRDAVRTAHARVDALITGGDRNASASELDDVVTVLESALAAGASPA